MFFLYRILLLPNQLETWKHTQKPVTLTCRLPGRVQVSLLLRLSNILLISYPFVAEPIVYLTSLGGLGTYA